MDIYNYWDYKVYLTTYLKSLPKKGHGQAVKIARALGVSPVIVSQVLNSSRNFTEEQALDCASYLGLSDNEAEYFLLIVRYARAGHHRLKTHLERKIRQTQRQAKEIANRLPEKRNLTESQMARYYSYWHYGGVRLAASLSPLNSGHEIAQYLQLPIETIHECIRFLIDHGLLTTTNGKLEWTDQSTHIPRHSLLVNRHHQNWRQVAFRQMEKKSEKDTFFTGPMVLSQKDADVVQSKILQLIEKVTHIAKSSDCESLRCLNIDWFSVSCE